MVLTLNPPAPSARIQGKLEILLAQIDTLLGSLSGSSLDARRQITRDLHFEPRAEELQAIVRIATDASTDGPRHDQPRRFLALRILAEREVKNVLEAKHIEAGAMRVSGELLADLLHEARRLEQELDRAVEHDETLQQDDREYLRKIADAFSHPHDALLANSVLALRLSELAEAWTERNLDIEEPALGEAERDLIGGFVAENIEQGGCRVTLDALAIRSHTDRLLAAWGELGQPSLDDGGRRSERDGILDQLKNARVALESVSARIQTQQDAALGANVSSLASELQAAGRGLFQTKLHLAPILRAPYVDTEPGDPTENRPGRLIRDLGDAVAEDQEAEAGPRRESEEELYLGALKDMHSRKEVEEVAFREKQRRGTVQRQRLRMKWMLATVGVLAVTSAIVNFVILPGGSAAPAAPDVRELKPVISAQRVEVAGPMMMTHVDGWNDLDDATRKSRVEKLGETVAGGGFGMVFVVDEYGDPAAVWDGGGSGGTGVLDRSDAP